MIIVEVTPMVRFKVGDLVRVISKRRSAASDELFGRVGVITKMTYHDDDDLKESSCCLDIEDNPRGGGGLWCDEIVLANDPNVMGVDPNG